MKESAKVITVSNFKGGSGKTTGTAGLSYVLAEAGYKTLVIDFDPQADITYYLMPDYDANEEEMTFFEAVQEGDLTPILKKVHPENELWLIPSNLDLTGLQDYMYKKHPRDLNKRNQLINEMIQPLRDSFDFIFIDVPPTVSFATNNALVASDYVIISLQTQGSSFRATQKLIPEIKELVRTLDIDLQILGVMAIIHARLSSSDMKILESAKELYEDSMFETVIQHRERIKSWGDTGITVDMSDRWDREAIEQFRRLANEIVERLQTLEVTS